MGIKNGLATCAIALGVLFVGGNAASADSGSIVDYLHEKGEDSSFSTRGELAADHGISAYRGTANQNIALLEKLRGGTYTAPAAPAATKEVQPKPQAKSQESGKTFNVVATAYTANCTGCSGTTATGINLKANPGAKVISVDPNVIPLGSRVYVEGYGEAIAGDTGGAIKGNRIDIFMPDHTNAINFGRRTVSVTVLN